MLYVDGLKLTAQLHKMKLHK